MKTLRLESGGEAREVVLENGTASLEGRKISFREIRRGEDLVALEIEGEIVPVRGARSGDRAFVWCAGQVFEIRRAGAAAARARSSGGEAHGGLLAPMPGRIRKTLVRRGDEVEKGQVVLVLEAMKMEHAIRAPHHGVVTKLEHREGDLVEAGEVLVEISPLPTESRGERATGG